MMTSFCTPIAFRIPICLRLFRVLIVITMKSTTVVMTTETISETMLMIAKLCKYLPTPLERRSAVVWTSGATP